MVQQLAGAGERYHAFKICHLTAFYFSILLLVVGVREVLTHRGQTRPAVRPGDNLFGVKSVFKRPSSPDPCHCRGGIDQDPVHVEQ